MQQILGIVMLSKTDASSANGGTPLQ